MKSEQTIKRKLEELKNRQYGEDHSRCYKINKSPRLSSKIIAIEWVLGNISNL